MKQDFTQSRPNTAHCTSRAVNRHPWMSNAWTGVVVTSAITVVAMGIGKETANLLGVSLIWAFPVALPLIAVEMVALARFARYMRRNDPPQDAEVELDAAA